MSAQTLPRGSDRRPLLVLRHMPWEGPHRILEAFAGVPIVTVDALDGEPHLPAPEAVRGALVMGGPMDAGDEVRYPGLTREVAWLRSALDAELPLLGVCLGAQLLARAIGGRTRRAARPEIGWAPVEVLDPADPLLAALAPRTEVLHWHRDAIELPPGSSALARSRPTAVQAFRAGTNAWGTLFHAEADSRLLARWLSEPTMAREARRALGAGFARGLGAPQKESELLERSGAMFAAFAGRCATRPRRRPIGARG